MTSYARELAVAEASVLRAAAVTKTVQSTVTGVAKEDQSPVTVADFAAQALLIAGLRQAFPDDSFVGEEDAMQLRRDPALVSAVYGLVQRAPPVVEGSSSSLLASPASVDDTLALIDNGGRGTGGAGSRRFWVMDPVDGTKTFLRRQQYAVSLALIEDGREVVGVLCCPNLRLQEQKDQPARVREESVDGTGLGMMMSAVRGCGAVVRDLSSAAAAAAAGPGSPPLSLSDLPAPTSLPTQLPSPSDLRNLHIVDSPLSKAIRHDVVESLATRLGCAYPGTDVWSSHMRYAALILGGADCQVRVPVARPASQGPPPVCIWDHAGAQLIFTEVGGVIGDLDGKNIDFGAGRLLSNNRGMICARAGIYEAVDALTKELLDKEKSEAS